MEKFQHFDYVGDAILKLLAFDLGFSTEWKWHSNKMLAGLHDSILGKLNNTSNKMKYLSFDLYAENVILNKNRSNQYASTHRKASIIESWLGQAYSRGGLSASIKLFNRLLELTNNTLV